MADFYLYPWNFWGHWWPTVAAGIYLGFDETARSWLPRVSEFLETVPGWWRRRIGVVVLIGTVFYAGFTVWQEEHHARSDEHDARIKAEQALTQRSQNLTRTLAYDNMGVIIENKDGKTILRGLAGRIGNLGQDTLRVEIKKMRMAVGATEIYNRPIFVEPYMPPGHEITLNGIFLSPDVVIPEQTNEVIQEWFVDYDTASSSGVRHSYRKIRYVLTWASGKCSLERSVVIDARED